MSLPESEKVVEQVVEQVVIQNPNDSDESTRGRSNSMMDNANEEAALERLNSTALLGPQAQRTMKGFCTTCKRSFQYPLVDVLGATCFREGAKLMKCQYRCAGETAVVKMQ